jgi:hypothetical protein
VKSQYMRLWKRQLRHQRQPRQLLHLLRTPPPQLRIRLYGNEYNRNSDNNHPHYITYYSDGRLQLLNHRPSDHSCCTINNHCLPTEIKEEINNRIDKPLNKKSFLIRSHI